MKGIRYEGSKSRTKILVLRSDMDISSVPEEVRNRLGQLREIDVVDYSRLSGPHARAVIEALHREGYYVYEISMKVNETSVKKSPHNKR